MWHLLAKTQPRSVGELDLNADPGARRFDYRGAVMVPG